MLDPTINTEDSHIVSGGRPHLTLRWLYPDADRPVVPILQGFRLGRDPKCLVLIDGEGVSRMHAEVLKQGTQFVLRDSGSTNGTFVGGQRITQCPIAAGGILRAGNWVGLFETSKPGSAPKGYAEIGPGLRGGPALRLAMEPARRAATSNLPVILRGETGTGKEVASKTLHAWSGRKGPFCAVNCAALPENLVEGELFGYRKGAFTGAERSSPGHFRRAHQGTLLLDEINELPLATQAKLLRVLQEQQVVPLGESIPIDIDVRVVAAAQAPLEGEVEAGRFREDLYMRLRGLEIDLPPLRERVADVPPLFMQFLACYGSGPVPKPEGKLIEALCLYRWPGNVRELELVARRLLAVHGNEAVLKRRFLPAQLLHSAARSTQPEDDLTRLGRALTKSGGNLSRACAQLGISRQRAYRMLGGTTVKEFMARHEADTTGHAAD